MKRTQQNINVKWTVIDLQNAISSSKNFTEVYKKLGFDSISNATQKMIRRYAEELNLKLPEGFDLLLMDKQKPVRYTIDQILCENSPCSGPHFKERLIKEGYLRNECYICSLKEWLGEPISLHMDHINGNPKDNRLENLRILCPNCHSQTPTYAGRKKIGEKNKTRKNTLCGCGNAKDNRAKLCGACSRKKWARWPLIEDLFERIKRDGLKVTAEKLETSTEEVVKRFRGKTGFDLKAYLNT